MRNRQPTARRVAAEVLIKVDRDRAYANLELDKRLRSALLSPRDRALATTLVYGTLRWRGRLDRAIEAAGNRKIDTVDLVVRNVLRLTLYQLLHLTHIPPHAAIDEGVELTRSLGREKATGFVNAIARRIQREGERALPLASDEAVALATAWSHPLWLVKRWLRCYGREATQAILAADQEPAPLVVRINTLRIARTAYLAKLQESGAAAVPGFTPAAVVVSGSSAEDLPGYREGWFAVQDESSQLAAYAVDPQPGETIADLCSAPGGKTTHLAQLMSDRGEVVAFELHQHRARLVAAASTRLGLKSVRVIVADSRRLPVEWDGRCHRILLDAPCSGTGVLRRRVDLRWRLQERDLAPLGDLQMELLRTASRLLRPGGRLVYSTCSIEPEENSNRIAAYLQEDDSLQRGSLTHLRQIAPQLAPSDRCAELEHGELQLLPSARHDGFFLACLLKR
jgi:16S rRNA (cytosine967-C5)-methyltransferase